MVKQAMRGAAGPFALQAAIVAVHCRAIRAADTDWQEIVRLYDRLAEVQPSPVVELNRAVAIGMAEGPATALALIEELAAAGSELNDYHLLHAARADFLRRLGRHEESTKSYERALVLTTNKSERRYLQRRLQEVRPRQAGAS